MAARLTSNALDMVATRLSLFREPDIPELKLPDEKTLQNNMLAGIIGAFSGAGNAPVRHAMTNIVRRVFASIEMYRLGRRCALDYVEGDRHSALIPYFLALTNFECCIGYCWQVGDLLKNMSGKNIFNPGDGSAWQRLHQIYTVGTKHSFGGYDPANDGEMPTTVWLTNEGIDCVKGDQLEFRELIAIIEESNQLFYDIQARALEKRKSARDKTKDSVESSKQ